MKRPLSGWWRLWIVGILPIAFVAFTVFDNNVSPPSWPSTECVSLTDNDHLEAPDDVITSEREPSSPRDYNDALAAGRAIEEYLSSREASAGAAPTNRPCTPAEMAARRSAYLDNLIGYTVVLAVWLGFWLLMPIGLFGIIRWIWRGFLQTPP